MIVINIPLDQIEVPDKRFRNVKKEKALEVAESIRQRGLLNPITVEAKPEGGYRLIAGEHRYFIFRHILKLPTIPASTRESLTELERREIELDENIHRLDMSPAERVDAIAEIHRLKRAKDPNWGRTETAAVVGSSRPTDVTDAIKLSDMMKLFPEIRAAKSVRQMKSMAEAKAANVVRTLDVRKAVKREGSKVAVVSEKIWLGDSVVRIKEIPDEQFRLILTDPPFGVDYDDKVSGTSGTITDYEDSKDSYERILSMASDLYRVLQPDGFLVWFFGMSWYEPCKRAFRAAGFEVDEIPVMWDRSDGKCFTRRPDRWFAKGYDVALHCVKGNPQVIRRGKPNVLRHTPVSTSDRLALVERPISLYREIIERLTVPGEKVADFFVGSGSCPAAAAACGRDFFGIELNEERRAIAINKITANLPK
jgi:ParB/RepB/Spo0J family partition protein